MPEYDEDTCLFQKFQEGDESAFEEILKRYSGQLLGFIYRYIGDKDEAEDLLSEVFLRIYHSAKTYRPQAKFSTYIYRVAANLCIDHLRRNKYQSEEIRSLQKDNTACDPQEITVGEMRGKSYAWAGIILGILYVVTVVVILIIKGPQMLGYLERLR